MNEVEQNDTEAKLEDEIVWSVEEDAKCVWLFFCTPICDILTPEQISLNRTLEQIENRYNEVISKPTLSERVKQYCNGNIFSLKSDVPFSLIEDFNYVCGKKYIPNPSFGNISRYFTLHLSRTDEQINERMLYLATKNQINFETQLEIFKKFKEEIISKYHDKKTKINNDIHQINDIFIDEKKTTLSNSFGTCFKILLNKISSETQPIFTTGDLAALRGKAGIFKISSIFTRVGRKSQFSEVEVDLSSLSNNNISRIHAHINFCNNLMFYIECKGAYLIINGHVIYKDEIAILKHGDIIDFGGYVSIFIERTDFLEKIRKIQYNQ